MSVNRASISAVFGAPGSGKSARIKQRLAREKPARLMIWDPQSEYGAFGQPAPDLQAVFAALKAAGRRGRFAIAYTPRGSLSAWRNQFDVFCKLAYAAGTCWLVADELADVTEPGWAPDGWSIATRKGRHQGLTIIGASQRPASVDKDFFGTATSISSGRLNFDGDVKVLANVLRVPAERIVSLQPLQYLERDMQTGLLTEGRVVFSPAQ